MRQTLSGFLIAGVLAAGGYAVTLRATPANLFSNVQILKTTFDEFDLTGNGLPDSFWLAKLKTKGQTDLYVVTNVWKPGGTTGWHTHPGPSLVIVTAGTLRVYEGDDPTCSPHEYSAGMGFVDPGDGHTHVVRNEGSVDASTTAVQFIPATAMRRIDAPASGYCPLNIL
jgi:hypothetical protein